MMLNQALVGRQPNTYSFLSSNGSIFYSRVLNLQVAHHQEILQTITPQHSLTDTSTDRHACAGLLHESLVPGTFLFISKIRAPMTDRHICDGLSSGTRCIINQQPDPTRLENFKDFQPLKPPTPSFEPFPSLFLPFPPFTTSYLSHHILYKLIHITSPNPHISFLLVGVCCYGSALDKQVPYLLIFLLFSGMCLCSLPIYIAFLFFNYY